MADVCALFLGYQPQLLQRAVSSFLKSIPPEMMSPQPTPEPPSVEMAVVSVPEGEAPPQMPLAPPAPAPLEIVVIENGEGGCGEWVRAQQNLPMPIRVIRTPQLSYAKAYNLAIKEIEANWLLLLNDDLIFMGPEFWQGLMRLAQDGNEIVGQKLIYPPGSKPSEHASPNILYIQHCGMWFTLDWFPYHVARWQPSDNEPANLDLYPPAVTFACVMIAKRVWDGLGGLDERYYFGFEDVDFCLRAKMHGASIACNNTNGLVAHAESQSTGQDTENKTRQWDRFQEVWTKDNLISRVLGVWPTWRFK